MAASKLTKAELVSTIEGLRAEIATLRLLNAQLASDVEGLREAARATGKPTYVRRPDPQAAEREAYRAYVATKRDEARERGVSVLVPGFAAWIAERAQAQAE